MASPIRSSTILLLDPNKYVINTAMLQCAMCYKAAKWQLSPFILSFFKIVEIVFVQSISLCFH